MRSMKELNGILDIKTNTYDCLWNINIKYNNELIMIKDIIKVLKEFPLIISFDKHSKNKLTNYQVVIKDLCCKECFNNIIKKLLLKDGIEYVASYYDDEIKDIKIDLKYDGNVINKEEILDLIK